MHFLRTGGIALLAYYEGAREHKHSVSHIYLINKSREVDVLLVHPGVCGAGY